MHPLEGTHLSMSLQLFSSTCLSLCSNVFLFFLTKHFSESGLFDFVVFPGLSWAMSYIAQHCPLSLLLCTCTTCLCLAHNHELQKGGRNVHVVVVIYQMSEKADADSGVKIFSHHESVWDSWKVRVGIIPPYKWTGVDEYGRWKSITMITAPVYSWFSHA